MSIELKLGKATFHAMPLRHYDEFPAFERRHAATIVPAPRLLNTWSAGSEDWDKPKLMRPIRVHAAVQCIVLDRFGNRDAIQQAEMFARIGKVAALSPKGLRTAVRGAVPAAEFPVDMDAVLDAAQRAEGDWEIWAEAEFEHFVMRAPGGRLDDWALLTIPADMVISKTPVGRPQGATGDRSEVVERVFAFVRAQNGNASEPA